MVSLHHLSLLCHYPKAYLALTVAEDCVLGATVTLAADEKELTEAYRSFKTEAQQLKPDYQTPNRQHRWLVCYSVSLEGSLSDHRPHQLFPPRLYQNSRLLPAHES